MYFLYNATSMESPVRIELTAQASSLAITPTPRQL